MTLKLKQLFKKRFYTPDDKDALPAKLVKRVVRRPTPQFPKTVQIQTITGCNAACIFCPYSETVHSQPKGRMSQFLFEKIVDEVSRHPVRRISPYLMNEPLLDPSLFERIALIKNKCRKTRIVLTSNGSLLTPEIRKKLFKSKSLHALYISFQGIEKEGYEETMRGRLVFEETKALVDDLITEWKGFSRKDRFKIIITMVATNKIDVRKAAAYWKSKGVLSKWTALENRGGNSSRANKLSKTLMKSHSNCSRLFKQAYIMFNGDMVLCCTDYTRKVVLGNIANSSIEAVWNGRKARAIRALYSSGQIDRIPLCRDCTIADVDDSF
jgi:radical SAM protein with 4Fe4S-binding SPASM domain